MDFTTLGYVFRSKYVFANIANFNDSGLTAVPMPLTPTVLADLTPWSGRTVVTSSVARASTPVKHGMLSVTLHLEFY
jgi:hypothetical protein